MSGNPLDKADEALQRRLASAAPGETISAIIEVALPTPNRPPAPLGGTPAATTMRRESRESAIAERAEYTQAMVGELGRMGLSPRSGRFLPFVQVRGPAGRLVDALSLEGVSGAMLDPYSADHQTGESP